MSWSWSQSLKFGLGVMSPGSLRSELESHKNKDSTFLVITAWNDAIVELFSNCYSYTEHNVVQVCSNVICPMSQQTNTQLQSLRLLHLVSCQCDFHISVASCFRTFFCLWSTDHSSLTVVIIYNLSSQSQTNLKMKLEAPQQRAHICHLVSWLTRYSHYRSKSCMSDKKVLFTVNGSPIDCWQLDSLRACDMSRPRLRRQLGY